MIWLYRVYQLVIMAPLMLIITALTAVTTAAGCAVAGGRWWGYWPAHVWSRMMCRLTWVSVSVSGRENIEPGTSYVFVANHQGAYDIFAVYGYLGHNFKWMMKRSLERIPLVGWACRRAGHIFVDNSSPHAIAETMHAAERQLAGGMSLVVFPEGARTFTGKVGRFKRGAYSLASEFGLPVVPVTIDGAFSVLPRTGRVPRWGHIHLTIHQPIASSAPDVIERSRQAVVSALPENCK
jgi:1-acyl-sn-glycerol-3-phosphate acyltransferase